MHPNYFIMLISFISPLQDLKPRQRPVCIQEPSPPQRGPEFTYGESHPLLHEHITVICCKANTGKCEKGNQREKETQGGCWAALKTLGHFAFGKGRGVWIPG